MVIDGYRWLFMVINVYPNSAIVILVIDGYLWLLMCIPTVQWLSVIISVTEK